MASNNRLIHSSTHPHASSGTRPYASVAHRLTIATAALLTTGIFTSCAPWRYQEPAKVQITDLKDAPQETINKVLDARIAAVEERLKNGKVKLTDGTTVAISELENGNDVRARFIGIVKMQLVSAKSWKVYLIKVNEDRKTRKSFKYAELQRQIAQWDMEDDERNKQTTLTQIRMLDDAMSGFLSDRMLGMSFGSIRNEPETNPQAQPPTKPTGKTTKKPSKSAK